MPKKYIPIVYRPNYRPMSWTRGGPKKVDEQTGIYTYGGLQTVDDFNVPSEYLQGSLDRYKGPSNAPTHADVVDNGLDYVSRAGTGSIFIIEPGGNQRYPG